MLENPPLHPVQSGYQKWKEELIDVIARESGLLRGEVVIDDITLFECYRVGDSPDTAYLLVKNMIYGTRTNLRKV